MLTENGAVQSLLTMLQKTLVMDVPTGASLSAPGQDGADSGQQQNQRDQLQVSILEFETHLLACKVWLS